MKKRMTFMLLLFLCLVFPVMAVETDAATVVAGSCGEKAIWSFDKSSGTLTISGEGAMDEYSRANTAPWYEWAEDITKVVIKSGITRLGNYTFCTGNYGNLSSVELADSVTSIGICAFQNLDSLTSIDLSHVTELETSAFFSCDTLQSVTFCDELQVIGSGAFTYCAALRDVQLPSNLLRFESTAFTYCAKAFTDLVVPEGVDRIGNMAFYGCDSMKSLVVPGTVSQINSEAFAKNPGLKEITFLGRAPYITEPIFGDVEATAYYPGNDTSWTEEVRQSYGGNITWIPVYPTEGQCGMDVYWRFEKSTGTLTTYGSGHVYGDETPPWKHLMDQIRSVVVEEGVTNVHTNGFHEAVNLETVILANTVGCIDRNAFSNCTSLKEITIPASVHTFFGDCFSGCTALERITFLGRGPELQNGSIFDNNVTATAYYPGTSPDWTEEVRRNCGGNITWIPVNPTEGQCGTNVYWRFDETTGTLTTYGNGYLDGHDAPPWRHWMNQIKHVVVEEGVCSVRNGGFMSAVNLKTVEIADTVTYIGGGAFSGCASLEEITIPASVTSFAGDTFKNSGLQKITFLGRAPELQNGSIFGNVTATAYYPGTNPYWTEEVRQNCGGNITWIPVNPTEGQCGTNVYWRFDETTGTLTTYGNGYLDGHDAPPWRHWMNQIKHVVVEEGVCSVRNGGFMSAVNLKTVEIADTVTYIGGGAFSGCASLKEITIPAGVTSFAGDTFKNSGLQKITFLGRAPELQNGSIFGNVTATAYYPGMSPDWTEEVRRNFGGTITWVPYCPGEHAYAQPVFAWQGNENCTATFSCSACGKAQNVSCTVKVETVPATETKEGKITYTATAVFDGKKYTDAQTQILPKLEHIHSFAESWLSDKTSHWKQCSACGEKKDVSAHIPGDQATENESQKCTICGHVLRTPLGLDWFFEKMENSSFLPSGFYAEIMEQYADFIG